MHAELLVFDEDPNSTVTRWDSGLAVEYFLNTSSPITDFSSQNLDMVGHVPESEQVYDNKLFRDVIDNSGLSTTTRLDLKRGLLQGRVAALQALILLQLPNLNHLVLEVSGDYSTIGRVIKEQAAALPASGMTRKFTELEHLELRPVTGWKPYFLGLTKLPVHKLRHLRTLRNHGHMLDPCSLELSVNPFLTSMTFTYSLQQIITNGRSVGCESLLAAIRHAPNLESFTAVIPLAGPSPTFLEMLMAALKGCSHSLKSLTLIRELEATHHTDLSRREGFAEGFSTFPKLEELNIDYGLFLWRYGHAVVTNVGQIAKSVKRVYIQGCIFHLGLHGNFKKWLKELVVARLADGLPNLIEVRYSLDGDHDREKRVVNNWKCVDHWKRDDLEEVGVELWRGLKRFTHQRTPGVTDSEEIVREWREVSDDGESEI